MLDYNKQILIVIAAGVKSDDIKSWMDKAGSMIPTFLIIPNIAIAHLQSMTFIVPAIAAEAQHTEKVKALFDQMGQSIITDEQHLAAGTTLASCGIAFWQQVLPSPLVVLPMPCVMFVLHRKVV